METIWFILIGVLLGGYIVLDGFDLGVGSLYLLVARNEAERNQVRSSIGPIWDGNEVWLIAVGGTLFFAFPNAYATTFSAFYLAFFMILWLLILRGLAIELRGQLANPLWHTFWDVTFSFASLSLAGMLGVALGNLLRGVPMPATGRYVLPFWTNLIPGAKAGLLDWYTLLVGALAIVTFALQGANFLVLKTEGKLQSRARAVASRSGLILVPLVLITFALTPFVQPTLRAHFITQPLGLTLPLLALGLLVGLTIFLRRQSEVRAFSASSLLILAMLATALYALYPNLVLDTSMPLNSLTIYNSATSAYGLRVGLIWFGFGFALLLAYVGVMYRSFWGKVPLELHNDIY